MFACGVILFLMVTGAMPFADRASMSDPVYSQLARGENKAFWDLYRVPVTVQEERQDSYNELYQLLSVLMSAVIIIIGKLRGLINFMRLCNRASHGTNIRYSSDF